jgi:hypothetical protein
MATQKPSYFLVSVSNKENLELCKKYVMVYGHIQNYK